MQAGLCDISISVDDIEAPTILPTQARPPKRTFAEIDEATGDGPDDELYGWIEDDEVAAEGLLVDEMPIRENDAPPSLGPPAVAESQNKKVARSTTV